MKRHSQENSKHNHSGTCQTHPLSPPPYTHIARTHTNTPECAHMERQTTIQTANTANSRNQNATIALCVCGKRGRKNGGGARKEWKTGAWIAEDGRRLSFNKVDLALATCCCWLSFPAPEVDFSPHSFPRLSLSPRFLSPFWVFPFFLRCARMRQDQINTRSHTHTYTPHCAHVPHWKVRESCPISLALQNDF